MDPVVTHPPRNFHSSSRRRHQELLALSEISSPKAFICSRISHRKKKLSSLQFCIYTLRRFQLQYPCHHYFYSRNQSINFWSTSFPLNQHHQFQSHHHSQSFFRSMAIIKKSVELGMLHLVQRQIGSIHYNLYETRFYKLQTIWWCKTSKHLMSSGLSQSLGPTSRTCADHSGCAVWGMKCLRPLEHWERGFEFHSRYRCLRLFCVCAVLCR
jgi:hypothetical protein